MKTPPAADRTVAETVNQRLNQLRPAERRVSRTLLADHPSAGRGYDGFTAVQSALRGLLTAVEGAGRVRWDIENRSNSELLLRRARQVSDLALEHRICVAAVASAELVTRVAVQRFQRLLSVSGDDDHGV